MFYIVLDSKQKVIERQNISMTNMFIELFNAVMQDNEAKRAVFIKFYNRIKYSRIS